MKQEPCLIERDLHIHVSLSPLFALFLGVYMSAHTRYLPFVRSHFHLGHIKKLCFAVCIFKNANSNLSGILQDVCMHESKTQ